MRVGTRERQGGGRGTEVGSNAAGSRGTGTGLRFVCSRSLTFRPGGELPVLCLLPSMPSGERRPGC